MPKETLEKYRFIPNDDDWCDVCIPEDSPFAFEENSLLLELRFDDGKWEVYQLFGIMGTRKQIARILDEIVEIANERYPTKEKIAEAAEQDGYDAQIERDEKAFEERLQRNFDEEYN